MTDYTNLILSGATAILLMFAGISYGLAEIRDELTKIRKIIERKVNNIPHE